MYKSVDIANNIKKAAKEKGVSVKQILEDCDLATTTIQNMKTSMPKTDTLAKLADCLDVSVDYLLGRNNKNSAPDEVRNAIISKVYSMPDDQCKKLLDFLESLASE